jgi:outer membrane protein OmpA-like peptidoglycan-associated protein
MRRGLIGVVLAGMIPLLEAGCATRGWVRDMTEKRVVSLQSLLAEQRQRMAGLETNITATAESVREARTRADAAYTQAEEVGARLTRLWANRHRRNMVETVEVYFGFDQATLDDAAQTVLEILARELKENPQLAVELAGYADARGAVPYNIGLSQRRVEAVRRHLVERGVELGRIQSIGLGPIRDGAVEDAKKRRVSVRLMVDAE